MDYRKPASLLKLDMKQHWQPTAKGFIGRMKKGQMLTALNEVGKSAEGAKVAKMKTAPAQKATAEALKGTGWLPQTLKAEAVK